MLCLILASCRCERVPAFLFVRPYLPQRRWDLDGEIKVFQAHGLPEWPKQIFRQRRRKGIAATTAEARALTVIGLADFYASTIGYRLDAAGAKFYNLSTDIGALCRQKVLSTHLDEDDVWLQLDFHAKVQIWRQTSSDDRLLLWFCLLEIVVFSYPDIYSEGCWEKVQRQCQDLVDSTVSPFLAVIGWEQLRSRRSL